MAVSARLGEASYMISFHIIVSGALVYTALFMACALLITSCKFPCQHSQGTAVASTLGPKPTAQQLIIIVQKNFPTVTAFHVGMKVENLGTAAIGGIQIR